jgi:hypothetical protein
MHCPTQYPLFEIFRQNISTPNPIKNPGDVPVQFILYTNLKQIGLISKLDTFGIVVLVRNDGHNINLNIIIPNFEERLAFYENLPENLKGIVLYRFYDLTFLMSSSLKTQKYLSLGLNEAYADCVGKCFGMSSGYDLKYIDNNQRKVRSFNIPLDRIVSVDIRLRAWEMYDIIIKTKGYFFGHNIFQFDNQQKGNVVDLFNHVGKRNFGIYTKMKLID